MPPTDQIITRISGEIEKKQAFLDGLVEKAEKDGRDLTSQELDLVVRARDEIEGYEKQVGPLLDAHRIAIDSRSRLAEVIQMTERPAETVRDVEYRSAGEYILEMWRGNLGNEDARRRLEIFHRAAAHQTTADNPGLLPVPVLGDVLNFVDASRPLVNALGPRDMPSNSWKRPKVTQHTAVAAQAGEKQELVSQKMIIGALTPTPVTLGGYVNISRQDLDFTTPGILDIVIQDLSAQYAIQTETKAATDLAAAAATGPTLPTGANDATAVAGALWTAAASIYNATKGVGRVFAVIDTTLLGLWGPLFPPVNPTNQQSQGFDAAGFNTGQVGNIAGIPIYVSDPLPANTALVLSSAAAEVYEQRIGALQVVEPSVLGLQVAYAGMFAVMPVEPSGIIKIVKTP